MLINGKIAVVTGAASGFGKGIAERLAAKGARLILSDVNDKVGQAIADALNKEYGLYTAIYVHCDVSDSAQLKNMFEQGIKAFERIDICINNAGIGEIGKFAFEPERTKWQKVIDIDLYAVIEGTQLALAQMQKQSPQGGVIVNIGSMAGFIPDVNMPIYVAAKSAVNMFTRSLNKLLYKNTKVRVVGIAPTFAETPLVTNEMKENESFRQLVEFAGTVPVSMVLDAIERAIEDDNLAGDILRVTRQKGIDLMPKRAKL